MENVMIRGRFWVHHMKLTRIQWIHVSLYSDKLYDKHKIKTNWADERIEDGMWNEYIIDEWQTGQIKVPRERSPVERSYRLAAIRIEISIGMKKKWVFSCLWNWEEDSERTTINYILYITVLRYDRLSTNVRSSGSSRVCLFCCSVFTLPLKRDNPTTRPGSNPELGSINILWGFDQCTGLTRAFIPPGW